MKLKLYTAAALLTGVVFVSCSGNKDKEVVDNSIVPAGSQTTTVQQPVAPATTMPNTNVLPANTVVPNTTTVPGTNTVSFTPPTQPVTVNPQTTTLVNSVPPTTTAATTTTTAPGMNPPHGQPGHRCDISVGAPLNSKPAATTQPAVVSTTPQQTQQPQVVTTTPVPTQTKTAPGMNPPHGEPNHRCDIAVGAPLNSKPTTPAVTTTTAPAPLMAPAKADSSKN